MRKIFKLALLGGTGSLFYPMAFTNTTFHYQQTEENEEILKRCTNHLKQFKPSIYLPTGLLQSAWNVYGQGKKDHKIPIAYEENYIKMDDGGQIGMFWAYPPQDKVDPKLTKVLIVFPGLSGAGSKGYIKSIVRHLTEDKGYIVGVFHNRGLIPFTSPHFADIASIKEIEKALAHAKQKFKDRPNVHFLGVGTSLGGNFMMRAAGVLKDDFLLEGMISFNNPFDVWLAVNLMRGKIYEKVLIQELYKNIYARKNETEFEAEIYR